MDTKQLGNNIAKFRKKRGMTQDNLAELLSVSPQAVSKWENDVSYPDIEMLPKLATIFGVSMDTLFSNPVTPETEFVEPVSYTHLVRLPSARRSSSGIV